MIWGARGAGNGPSKLDSGRGYVEQSLGVHLCSGCIFGVLMGVSTWEFDGREALCPYREVFVAGVYC
jgi:hypothetical protein